MNALVNQILSRLISTEIGHQKAWGALDNKYGIENNREAIILELKKWAFENDVKVDPHIIKIEYFQELQNQGIINLYES